MVATANTAQARYLDTAEQMLAFQVLPDDEDDENGSANAALASILSSDLLRGRKAVTISHNVSTYRLQATRLG